MFEAPGLVCPLTGPRTALWLFKKVARSGAGTFVARHHRWARESGVPAKSKSVHEHQLLSHALDIFIQVDRLNAANVFGVELLARRLQLVEEVHVDTPENPSWEGSEHFMGDDARKGGALIAPSLKAHVASELQKESQIMEEKRKAAEAKKK